MATTRVAQATATGTSDPMPAFRPTPRAILILSLTMAVAVAVSACGSSAASPTAEKPVSRAGALGSLRGVAPPPGWVQLRGVAGGAVLAAPATWHRVEGDPGSVTFELGRHPDRPLGYINATPATPEEHLPGWIAFRLRHNREDGDQEVRLLGARSRVHLGTGTLATCVQDAYSTRTARYIEIACLAQTPSGRTVIVAASPQQTWTQQRATLTRAVEAAD
jgi:hypothetical protein